MLAGVDEAHAEIRRCSFPLLDDVPWRFLGAFALLLRYPLASAPDSSTLKVGASTSMKFLWQLIDYTSDAKRILEGSRDRSSPQLPCKSKPSRPGRYGRLLSAEARRDQARPRIQEYYSARSVGRAGRGIRSSLTSTIQVVIEVRLCWPCRCSGRLQSYRTTWRQVRSYRRVISDGPDETPRSSPSRLLATD